MASQLLLKLRQNSTATHLIQFFFLPNFALAVMTKIEHIFPLFQRNRMENGTPEVDQVLIVTL